MPGVPARRALLIACRQYGAPPGTLPEIPDANASAQAFHKWLLETKDPECLVFVCADDDYQAPGRVTRRYASTRNDILRAVTDIIEGDKTPAAAFASGADATRELLVFYSGHGFQVTPELQPDEPRTVLVATDFTPGGLAGASCIPLDDLQRSLRRRLGGPAHYYFIDACRTTIPTNDVIPMGALLSGPSATNGFPVVWTLFSSRPGAAAANDDSFARALLDGLRGQGRAKSLQAGGWVVTMDTLRDFAGRRTRGRAERRVQGDGPGVILQLPPAAVSPSTCNVAVLDGKDGDRFALEIHDARDRLLRTLEFEGAGTTLSLDPDDYKFALSRTEPEPALFAQRQPDPAMAVDLYQDSALQFSAATGFEAGFPSTAALTAWSTGSTIIRLRDLRTGEVLESPGGHSSNLDLLPGKYRLEVRQFGSPVQRREITLAAGDLIDLDLFGPLGPIHEGILAAVDAGAKDVRGFSADDSMKRTAISDLALWIALLAGGRIIGEAGRFPRIEKLPLEDFRDLAPGGSGVQVVVACDAGDDQAGVVILDGNLRALAPVPGLPGVYQARFTTPPGNHRIEAELASAGGTRRVKRLATCALANRVTVVAVDARAGVFDERQLCVPPAVLRAQQRPDSLPLIDERPLDVMRFLLSMQAQFAAHIPVAPDSGAEDDEWWYRPMPQRWFDPITCLIAGYELLRRGSHDLLAELVMRLRAAFPTLPDVAVLAAAVGQPSPPADGPPLILDGYLAAGLPDRIAGTSPASEYRLATDGAWTSFTLGSWSPGG